MLSVDVLEGPNIVSTDADLNRMGQTLRGQWGADASGVTRFLIDMGLNQERGADAYQAAQAAQKQLDHGHALTNVTLGSLYQKVMGSLQAEGAAIAAETGVDQQTVATPEEQGFLEGLKGEPAESDFYFDAADQDNSWKARTYTQDGKTFVQSKDRQRMYEVPAQGDIGFAVEADGTVILNDDVVSRLDEQDYRDFIKAYAALNLVTQVDPVSGLEIDPKPITIKSDGSRIIITQIGINDVAKKIRGAGIKSQANVSSLLLLNYIIENAQNAQPMENKHGKNVPFTDYTARFSVGGKTYDVLLHIKNAAQGSRYHYHTLNEIEVTPVDGSSSANAKTYQTGITSTTSIPQPPGKVKLQSAPDTVAGLGFQQGLDPGAGRIAQMKATLQGGVEAAAPEPSSPLETRLRQERGMDQPGEAMTGFQDEIALEQEGPFTGEPSGGIIQNRSMAMGFRRPASHILTEEEIASVKVDAEALGIEPSVLCFNTGERTGFMDDSGMIGICGDILPDLDSKVPRDRMSQRAVLAHEYYGHLAHHPSEYPIGDWRDEFRASYDAAVNAPGLTDEDRALLMLDAYDRAREAGEILHYDETARRIIYGY